MIRTENWCGYKIRFVEHEGEWWAILKDICDALRLKTFDVSRRIDPKMMTRVSIDVSDAHLTHNRSRGDNKTRSMVIINELGIYEALFASRRPEARKFKQWTGSVLKKLRSQVGLEGYEVMRMTEPEIQDDIDHIIDTLFWDEEKKMVMQSVTVWGGDVEQVPFVEGN